MKIVTVIPLKKGIPKGDLTYFTSLDIAVGNIVSVPLKNRKILAMVASSEELKGEKSNIKRMNFNLRKVMENKGSSIFLQEFFDTISDLSKYFVQYKNNTIASLIPNILIEEYDKIVKIKKGKKNILTTPYSDSQDNERNLRAEKLLFQYRTEDRMSTYKTLVRESFARGKSVFIVLPTHLDIEKFESQLSKGIEQFTFSVHSGISTKKILITLQKIINSDHPVLIIGTPPFLSIPKKDIGTIILEHESSNAYRMMGGPHFDLRVFVEIYASKINARYIMADEMLRFETIGRKDTDDLHPLHPLSFRIDFMGEIEVLGREKRDNKKFQIFNEEAVKEIRFALQNKKSVFVFSLRKGLATVTACKDCGDTVSCEKCGAPLVLYMSHQGKKRMFVCNRCEREIDGDVACINCKSWNLMPLGIGTDTVLGEIKKLFPKVKMFKLDKESAKTTAGAKKIMKEFEENEGSILVGTEMAFFYLREKFSLSVVASFDSLWSIPNFKMGEKIIQITLSIISNTKDKLIIQTKNKDNEAILAVKSGNLLSFVREELKNRNELNYPPFKRFIKITFLGDKEQTIRARKLLKDTFEGYSPEIFSGFTAQFKGKYVTNALIKINPEKWSLPEILSNSTIDENLFNKLLALEPPFKIAVDPEDLL